MPVRVPAEWTEQEWLWIGFPHAADLWLEDLVAGGRAAGQAWETAYRDNAYHGPDDEYDPNWSWAGTMQDLQLFYRLGRMLAETSDWPNWYEADEFRRIRDESCAPAGGC